jgi:DNA-binding MarR family transcriptional regulator
MNLKHVRTFVAVAETGTVSAAAESLRITQPALSRQIQSLQLEVGLRLFDQVNRRLVLTSNGEEFLRHCRALVAHADATLASAQSLGRGKTGVLRVGAAPQTIAAIAAADASKARRNCHAITGPSECNGVPLCRRTSASCVGGQLFAQSFERTVEFVAHAADGKIDAWWNVEILVHDLLEYDATEPLMRRR